MCAMHIILQLGGSEGMYPLRKILENGYQKVKYGAILTKCGYKINVFSWKQFQLKNRTALFAIISKWLDKDKQYFFIFYFFLFIYCFTAQVLKVCRTPGPTACSETKMVLFVVKRQIGDQRKYLKDRCFIYSHHSVVLFAKMYPNVLQCLHKN